MWWRCGDKDISTIHTPDIFRPFIRKIYFDHSFARYISTIHTQDIFRPFIRQIYFARDLRKIFRKSVEKYFDHSYARDLRKRLTQGLVKMWWRCGDKDISTIHTPDIFRKISEDVVKVWWKFVEGFMFLNSLFVHIVLYHYS